MSSPSLVPAEAAAAADGAPRMLRALRLVARLLVGGVIAGWSLLLIAWLTLHWGILPHVNEWRPQIERRAGAALGVPVEIGEIRVQTGGWMPALTLTDVVLRDREGREGLRLPKVSAAVSARSLLTLQLRFEQLHIEGASLDIRRDAQGRVHVAGLDLEPSGAPDADLDQRFTQWFFTQHEFVVRGGRLRWTDERRNAPPLALEQVDVVVRNGLKRHSFRLDATPPPDWGERFTLQGQFNQPLLARAGDWRRWDGLLYADLARGDVSALGRYVDLPFQLHGGDGALRVWAEVSQAALRGVTADVALREVALGFPEAPEPLAFAQVQGRLRAKLDERQLSVGAERFGFTTGDAVVWPPGRLQLTLRRDAAGAVSGGELGADRLDLGVLARIAAQVPVGRTLRNALAESAPEGLVHGLAARWDGALDAPAHYSVQGRFTGLSVAAAASSHGPDTPGRPGWRNATLDLRASERGGEAQLALDDGSLTFPGVFAQPEVAFDHFKAQLAWRIDRAPRSAPALEVRVGNARFASPEAQGEFSAVWRTGRGADGYARRRALARHARPRRQADARAGHRGRALPAADDPGRHPPVRARRSAGRTHRRHQRQGARRPVGLSVQPPGRAASSASPPRSTT